MQQTRYTAMKPSLIHSHVKSVVVVVVLFTRKLDVQ